MRIPAHPGRASPRRWAAPSTGLHSRAWQAGVGPRGAWRPARCKHLHGAMKAALDAGPRLGSAVGCRAPPRAHFRRLRLLATARSRRLRAICISVLHGPGTGKFGALSLEPPLPPPVPRPLPHRRPMGALAQDLQPPDSSRVIY